MQPSTPQKDDPVVVATIRAAADRHQVPRSVALAFAWCESRLNPNVEGDLDWHNKRGGELYRSLVLHGAKWIDNPARLVPEIWHSYGLYQLNAVYHLERNELPSVLLNPAVNADRGCREIARLMHKTGGDVEGARLAYVGCGISGRLCADSVVAATVQKLQSALARYATEDADG